MQRNLAAIMVLVGVSLSARANAYLDAGTGSYVLQMVIAGSLGAVFTVKTYWRVLKSKLTNRS